VKSFDASLTARAHRAVTGVVGSVLGLVMPGTALRYYQARRTLLEAKRRSYVAGRPDGPNAGWTPRNLSADSEIKQDGKRVLARARDLERNDSRIKGAVNTIVKNVVRKGIWPQPAALSAGGKPAPNLSKALAALWHAWAPVARAGKKGSIYALQKLALRHLIVDGEVMIHAVTDPKSPALPLRFELIECDQLDDYVDGVLPGGNVARRGVEFGQDGSVAAYWILPQHPGDNTLSFLRGFGQSRRISSEDCTLVFVEERASQTRGVSWLSSIAMRAFDLTEYDDYEMIGAKLAAAFGVFITMNNSDGVNPLAAGQPSDGSGVKKPVSEFIDPGRIQYLLPGEDVKIAEHDRPGDNYAEFVSNNKRDIAAGLGLSYETFSGDYRGSSYSSARQAILEERTGYTVLQDFLCEQLLDWIYAQFVRAVYLSGLLPMPGYARNPLPYQGKVWVCPGWSWIDPSKDSKAAQQRIDLGISSRTREASAIGVDHEEVMVELLREEDMLLALAKKRAERIALETASATPSATPAAEPDEGEPNASAQQE
jgi:lambda family phage portal protein